MNIFILLPIKVYLTKLFALGIGVLSFSLLANASDLPVLKTEACAALSSNDFKTVESLYSRITEASPNDADAWHGLGNSLDAQNKSKKADEAYSCASELYAKQYRPFDPALLYELTLSTMCAGDDVMAGDYAREGVRKFPDDKNLAKLYELFNGLH